MSSRVIQVFKRPNRATLKKLKYAEGSINLRPWRAYDSGMVGFSRLEETSAKTIGIAFEYNNTTDEMLTNNRMIEFGKLIDALEIVPHSPPLPLGSKSQHSDWYLWCVSEGEDLIQYDAAEPDRTSKTHAGASVVNHVVSLIQQGEELSTIQRVTGLSPSTLKRIRANVEKGGEAREVSFGGEFTLKTIPLMQYSEGSQAIGLLPLPEQRQLIDILRAGIHYRDAAEMFGVNARDVRLLGIRPTADTVTV